MRTFSIAVHPSEAALYDRAMALSRQLSIPFEQSKSAEYDFLLVCSAKGLALLQTGQSGLGQIMADFTSPSMLYRIKHGGGRSQTLARAVGLKKGWQPTVIDATAGLGRDGFILAHLGCFVHMLERSSVLAVLLADALLRAEQSGSAAGDIMGRLKLTHIDSRYFLEQLQQEDYADVIYLDPMYPERSKSSLVKKEMRILRYLAGDDQDARELFEIARNRARNRVVVKRPRLAPTLGSVKPSHQITGKTSRFDVYLI